MKLVCISDTHGMLDRVSLPPGDVLVHAGDLTSQGTIGEVTRFVQHLAKWRSRYRHVVVIAGNHDRCFENQHRELAEGVLRDAGIIYLMDSGVELDGVRFYGSPWQPRFGSWAFNVTRGPEIDAKWLQIPSAVDVLVTHGPPYGILDTTYRGTGVGCASLRQHVLTRIRPLIHAFGHIHEAYGAARSCGTRFINASCCDEVYEPVNPARVVRVRGRA